MLICIFLMKQNTKQLLVTTVKYNEINLKLCFFDNWRKVNNMFIEQFKQIGCHCFIAIDSRQVYYPNTFTKEKKEEKKNHQHENDLIVQAALMTSYWDINEIISFAVDIRI